MEKRSLWGPSFFEDRCGTVESGGPDLDCRQTVVRLSQSGCRHLAQGWRVGLPWVQNRSGSNSDRVLPSTVLMLPMFPVRC